MNPKFKAGDIVKTKYEVDNVPINTIDAIIDYLITNGRVYYRLEQFLYTSFYEDELELVQQEKAKIGDIVVITNSKINGFGKECIVQKYESDKIWVTLNEEDYRGGSFYLLHSSYNIVKQASPVTIDTETPAEFEQRMRKKVHDALGKVLGF